MLQFSEITYQSPAWRADSVFRQYVRYDRTAGKFVGYDVGFDGMTYREGVVSGESLALDVKAKAVALASQCFSQVRV